MTKHKVSIIIPTYNREKYIVESIKSVISQDWDGVDFEIIVIDDGSTDNTREVLQDIHNNIKYKKIKHTGSPAAARNVGLKIASGSIIAFQDSDDLWSSHKIRNQLKFFDDDQAMISFGQALIMTEKGEKTAKRILSEKILSDINFDNSLISNPVNTLTCMVRRSALDRVGVFNESLTVGEDYELWLRIINKYPKGVRATNDTLAYYRIHNNNISRGSSQVGIDSILRVFNELWSRDLEIKNRLSLEKAIDTMEENWSRNMNLDNAPPEISVVMSVYNGERFLGSAIDSILKQTMSNFEFIIINDGSTDHSVDIIKSYGDPRIRLISQTNHGLVFSLKKGIRLSRSNLIARMDADDISMPTRFSDELNLINSKDNLGLVSSYFRLVDFEKAQPVGIEITPLIESADIKRSFIFVNPIAHGASLFKKRAYLDAGGYREDYGPTEDYDLWRRMAKTWDIGIVPKVLYSYRVNNPNSISQTKNQIQEDFVKKIRAELINDPKTKKSLFRIIKDFKALSRTEYGENLLKVKDEYINNQYTIARTFIENGKPLKGSVEYLSMLFLKPKYLFNLASKVPSGVRNRLKKLK